MVEELFVKNKECSYGAFRKRVGLDKKNPSSLLKKLLEVFGNEEGEDGR